MLCRLTSITQKYSAMIQNRISGTSVVIRSEE